MRISKLGLLEKATGEPKNEVITRAIKASHGSVNAAAKHLTELAGTVITPSAIHYWLYRNKLRIDIITQVEVRQVEN